jgi:hypothetical protein
MMIFGRHVVIARSPYKRKLVICIFLTDEKESEVTKHRKTIY